MATHLCTITIQGGKRRRIGLIRVGEWRELVMLATREPVGMPKYSLGSDGTARAAIDCQMIWDGWWCRTDTVTAIKAIEKRPKRCGYYRP